jgi:very-short-patch-repair endonuclease
MTQTYETVAPIIRAHGGALSHRLLELGGFHRAAVAKALSAGTIIRVRPGWFAAPDTPRDVVRAVRVGGAVTAASAARLDGIWLHEDPLLHVRVPRTAARLRGPDESGVRLDRRVHKVCVHYRSEPDGPVARDPLPLALAEMLACAGREAAIAAIDSALSQGLLGRGGLETVRELTMPSRHRVLEAVRHGSESGTESRIRLLLRSRNIPHQPQARIRRVGYVDLLVGERLVIEIDGAGFHTGPEFEEDRRRDFELVMQGYFVLRLSYRQVMKEWELVSDGILALVARGEHRWGARAIASAGLATALKKV